MERLTRYLLSHWDAMKGLRPYVLERNVGKKNEKDGNRDGRHSKSYVERLRSITRRRHITWGVLGDTWNVRFPYEWSEPPAHETERVGGVKSHLLAYQGELRERGEGDGAGDEDSWMSSRPPMPTLSASFRGSILKMQAVWRGSLLRMRLCRVLPYDRMKERGRLRRLAQHSVQVQTEKENHRKFVWSICRLQSFCRGRRAREVFQRAWHARNVAFATRIQQCWRCHASRKHLRLRRVGSVWASFVFRLSLARKIQCWWRGVRSDPSKGLKFDDIKRDALDRTSKLEGADKIYDLPSSLDSNTT